MFRNEKAVRSRSTLVIGALLVTCVSFPAVAQPFTDIQAGLPGVLNGGVSWGDYDNDGDLDLALVGAVSLTSGISRIFRNDGNNTFTDIAAPLAPAFLGTVEWSDYDADGDLDLAMTGLSQWTGTVRVTKVYRNDGGTFTDTNAATEGAFWAALAWGDCDNDGDPDLAVVGRAVAGAITRIYLNQGDGAFTELNPGLVNVYHGTVAWADYDNDGDLDLTVTGYANPAYVTRIYRNDGNGVFTDSQIPLVGVEDPALAWGDYDNDGDLDLVLAGDTSSSTVTKLYRNDGGDTFSEVAAGFERVGDYPSLAWGDCDNDGDLDLALAGHSSSGLLISRIYRNDGGSFSDMGANLLGLGYGCSQKWGDYDADGDLDLLIAGQNPSGGLVTTIYRNDGSAWNSLPSAPAGLSAQTTWNAATFCWSAAADAQTPFAGLSYNLRVGTAPGAGDVFCGMADPTSGRRTIAAIGNTQKRLSWTLKNLPAGTYHWTVQAVDTGLAGSPWAESATVQVVASSDLDGDQDVDLADFGVLQRCFNGEAAIETGCETADLDGNHHVDGDDLIGFLACLSGPGQTPKCH